MAQSIQALTASVQALVDSQATHSVSYSGNGRSTVEKPVVFKGKDFKLACLFRSAFMIWVPANEDHFMERNAQNAKVRNQASHFVLSALSFMTEDAAVWAHPHIEILADGKPSFPNWASIIAAFKLKFEPVSPEADAKNKVIGMRQGKWTFSELIADFEIWSSHTGWSDQDLFDRLKQTLNADYITRLLYFPVIANNYATLKAYSHAIDLQLSDLQNNQHQASSLAPLSLASCTAPGFCNLNAMDIDASNFNDSFRGLSGDDILKHWHKVMCGRCCCCGSKGHENSLERHLGPPIYNHRGKSGHYAWVCLSHIQGRPATQRVAATGFSLFPAPIPASIASSTSIVDHDDAPGFRLYSYSLVSPFPTNPDPTWSRSGLKLTQTSLLTLTVVACFGEDWFTELSKLEGLLARQ